MKPIKVRIRGLNSFEDEQEIDFEKLTRRGLFGIFGPTGSGKTTILDSITLALYGEVARKSSNFMNTNCTSLNISFQFQISGKDIKRYLVEREFRRDNKTGSVRSKSAKIIDITLEPIVLEEGAKSVTEKCEEIIGLSLDDFTRTVVLPQGKFSEFLKLEGKERRNMLERLFNLQEYGDELSIKLNRKIKEEREKENVLTGELKGYEGLSEEILKEKKASLKENEDILKDALKGAKKAEEEYNEGKEIWNLQIEIAEKTEVYRELKRSEEEINVKEKKAILGEGALKVKPYIDNYENTLKQIEELKEKIINAENEMKTVVLQKEDIEKKLKIAKDNKDNALPKFMIKKHVILEAIEEKKILDKTKVEEEELKRNIDKLSKEVLSKDTLIKEYISEVNVLTDSIQTLENKIGMLKVSEDKKNKINEGMFLLKNYDDKSRHMTKVKFDIDKLEKDLKQAKENENTYLKELEESKVKLQNYRGKLEKLNKELPKDEVLLTFQENLNELRQKWNKYKENTEKLEKSSNNLEKLKQELKNEKLEVENLDCKLVGLNTRIEAIETGNMAHILREKLKNGEPCPVCGSVHHVKEEGITVDLKELNELKNYMETYDKKLKKKNEEVFIKEANIKLEEKNIFEVKENISTLGEEFKKVSVENKEKEFKDLKDKINKFNTEKLKLEEKIKVLTEASNKIEIEYQKEKTVGKQCENHISSLKTELLESKAEVSEIENEIKLLREELKIQDFQAEMKEIQEKERLKAKAEDEIKKSRNLLNEKHTEKEKLMENTTKVKEELSIEKEKLKQKENTIKEKTEFIKGKVGTLDKLDEFKEKIEGTIKKIEEQYNLCEKMQKDIEEKYRKVSDEIIKYNSNTSSLKDRKVNDIEKLNKILLEEKFKDIKDVKESYISREEINLLKGEIEKYRNEILKINGAIEVLNKKLKNRVLSEEKWIEIQNNRIEKDSKLKKLEEIKIKLEEEIKNIEGRLKELGTLLKNKKTLEHRLSLLDDLEKLFKGKKFVEFVALNQLKYISIEASKRLKEITAGNFGLEVDDNGKFLIRDYKNGGAMRDASTLSGGETFVASLALALSLSNQIQLKGSAPLELFFLDEGFGTLDSNLLEVVMDSIEKIHNERLSVGIISHLEAIKERVPVKLIVSPAEAGVGGSKVKLEVS
ncbi:AAA family ATPase [Clostridium felsineum]|uniref:AAA family ATPase n=1 Tax=Clostridium felsineum TaxID=36839 RepID=UPI00098C967C|nr:SbcC/MukB-like Walker B domain-containing protein [Clostridium felsineum]URZ04000.1 Chromosome partition protein Smc [Clostridium felsineum]